MQREDPHMQGKTLEPISKNASELMTREEQDEAWGREGILEAAPPLPDLREWLSEDPWTDDDFPLPLEETLAHQRHGGAITSSLCARIGNLLAEGMSRDGAGRRLGLSDRQTQEYCNIGATGKQPQAQFLRAVMAGRAVAEGRAARAYLNAAGTDWRAGKEWLASREPESWGAPASRVQVEGASGPTVGVQVNVPDLGSIVSILQAAGALQLPDTTTVPHPALPPYGNEERGATSGS